MPIFTIAGGAIATGVLGLTAGTSAFAITSSLIAAGLAYGTGKITGVFDVPEISQDDPGVEARVNANPLNTVPVLYGQWMQRGIVTFFEASDDKSELYVVLTLGEGPATSIDDIYWGDLKLKLDSSGEVTSAVDSTGTKVTKLNGNLNVQTYLGGDSNRSTYLEGKVDDWTSAHAMTGLVYAVITVKYNRDKGVTGLSDMRFVGVSPNADPSDAVMDQLTNSTYGLGLTASEIDATSFASAKTYFSTDVTYNDRQDIPVTAKRFQVNGSVSTSESVKTRIEQILRGSNSSLRWSNGKYSLFINKADTATAFTFDEDNIIGNLEVAEVGMSNLTNRLVINYGRNEFNNWQRNTIYLEALDSVKYANEPLLERSIDLPLVATNIEAQRIGTVILNQSRQQLALKHVADATAMSVEAGDVVKYTDEDYGWDDKLFRVVKVSEIDNGTTLTYEIESVEYATAVYTESTLNEFDIAPNVGSISNEDIPAVTDLAASNFRPNGSPPRFDLTWTRPTDAFIDQFEIYYGSSTDSFDDAEFLKAVRKTGGRPYLSGESVSDTVENIPAGSYRFWVVGSSPFGSSGESNTAVVNNWSPQLSSTALKTVRLFSENNTDDDPGNPGEGTDGSTNTDWYVYDPDSSTEDYPHWEAQGVAEQVNGANREISFDFSGVSGDQDEVLTDVTQVVDFTFSGTAGQAQTFAARPEIGTLTLSGQAAEADSVDPGVEEVWKITATGSSDATITADNEEFYIAMSGSSGDTPDASAGEYYLNITGESGSEVTQLVDSTDTLNYTFTYGGSTGARISISGNAKLIEPIFANTSDKGPFISQSVWPNGVEGGDIRYLRISTTDESQVELWKVTLDDNSAKSGFSFLLNISAGVPGSKVDQIGSDITNGTQVNISIQTSSVIAANPSSVRIQVDSLDKTYALATGLNTDATLASDLATTITADTSFTGYTVTSATEIIGGENEEVVKFVSDDNNDHTFVFSATDNDGDITVSSGTLVESNDGIASTSTVRIQIATDGIDETVNLTADLTDSAALCADLSTLLNAVTNVTDEFTVTATTDTINGVDGVDIVKLVSNDNTDHTLAVTFTNNDGNLDASESGSLVDGIASSTATTIRVTYDSSLSPSHQDITFGAQDATEMAAMLTSSIDGHDDLSATQGSVVNTTTDIIATYGVPILAADNRTNLVDGHPYDATFTPSSGEDDIGNPVSDYLFTSGSSRADFGTAITDADDWEDIGLAVSNADESILNTGRGGQTIALYQSDGNYALYEYVVGLNIDNDESSGHNAYATLDFLYSVGELTDVSALQVFQAGLANKNPLAITAIVSSSLVEDLTSASTTVKVDEVGAKQEPTISVTTQGTGDAAFTVSTEVDGRSSVEGAPSYTKYVINLGSTELDSGVFGSGNSAEASAEEIRTAIHALTNYSAAIAGAVVTFTGSANTDSALTLSITAGTNESGKTSTNDLASTKAVTQFGFATDKPGGEDATVTVNVGGVEYATATGDADDTLNTIATAVASAITSADADNDFTGQATGAKVRATSVFTGADPAITAVVTPGSTATLTASTGAVVTSVSDFAVSSSIINSGEAVVVNSGDYSSYTVTQGTTELISATDLSGAASASAIATEIQSALSALSNLDYTTSVVGASIEASSTFEDSSPNLVIAVSSGSNEDDTDATLALATTVNVTGNAPTLDYTDTEWDYYIISREQQGDDDLTEVNSDGQVTVRRGIVLDSTAIQETSSNYSATTLEATTRHTTGSNKATLVISGLCSLPALLTETADSNVGFTFEYSSNPDDATPTWTTLQTSPLFSLVNTADNGGAIVVAPLGISGTFDAAVSTEYAFRVVRTGTNAGSGGITFNLLVLEELRA